MFEDWLREHDLASSLVLPFRPLFPAFRDRERWEAILPEHREQLLRMAADWRGRPWGQCTASRFMAFVRDGSRAAYEEPYFGRRRKLIAAALGCCVSGDLAGLDDVIDGIWLICEETSWVISAHNGSSHEGMRPAAERPLPDITNPYIDLFAAQTAMILSIVCDLLGPELDAVTPLVRRRVALELERRILTPFMTRDDYWWMGFIRKDLCNWTPWIISNVMLTACYAVGDRLRLGDLLSRGCRMVDRWLDVMPQDGGCDEGAGYWNMAGGALLDCLDLLEHVSGGAMTFWQDEKLRNILSFPLRAQLPNGWYVNFADCDAHPSINGERLQRAGEVLGDDRLLSAGMAMRSDAESQIGDVPHLWRLMSLLFHAPHDAPATASVPRDVWLPDLQLRVYERQGMILVAKGGHNGESHNHNDVGSFMLYVDGEPVLVDAGNMTYTAKTFSDERYTLWNVRSLYLSQPIIGGCEQLPGREHRCDACERLEDGLLVSFPGAYGK